jgi:hypothetical protein
MDAMRLYTLLCILCTFLPLTLAQQETPEVLAQKRVVMIRATLESQGQLNEVFGAGVIAGWENGLVYIFTANHVVRERFEIAENITAEFFDFPGRPVTALLLRDFDSERDLAMVSVDTSLLPQNVIDALPPLVTGDVNTLRFGERVFAVGYKGSKTWATLGLSEFYDLELDMVVFGSSSIDKGASGGGLFNENWELIGMVLSTNGSEAQALRIDRITEQLGQWRYPTFTSSPTLSTPDVVSSTPPNPTSTTIPPIASELTQSVTLGYPCVAEVIVSSSPAALLDQVYTLPDLTAPLTTAVRQGSSVTIVEEQRGEAGSWYSIMYGLIEQNRSGWLPGIYLELSEGCPKNTQQITPISETPIANGVYPCEATVIISTFAGNGLNQVRSAPGLGAPLTSPVRQGSTISVTEKADTADGIWYKISYSYNQQDRAGWLAARFLELAETCPQ